MIQEKIVSQSLRRPHRYGPLSIEDLAKAFSALSSFGKEKSPLLDPKICQKLVDHAHKERHLDWSFGDYLVRRTLAWQGSYLEKDQRFVHVGVDVNLPPGTPVHVPEDLTIIKVDDDKDPSGGWGPRIIAKDEKDGTGIVLAHLQNVIAKEGDYIRRGTKLAEVGSAPHNGNWWSHLHIQAISPDFFREMQGDGFRELDGYITDEEVKVVSRRFPDPHHYMSRIWELPLR